MDLKEQLKQLIVDSTTFKALGDDERKARTDAMLSAPEEAQAEFIKILGEEATSIAQIDANYEKDAEKLTGLLAEAKQLEKQAEGMFRREKEEEESVKDNLAAEDILKKLDNVTG